MAAADLRFIEHPRVGRTCSTLEYADPQSIRHAAFQIWKTHPFLKKNSRRGKLVAVGRNRCLRRCNGDAGELRGWRLIIGDSGKLS